MKRLLLLICWVFIMVSCEEDDDTVVVQCTTPNTITLVTSSTSTATISWEDANTSASFDIEYGLSGFVLGTGTQATVSTTSIALSGLNSNTDYDFYVKSVCSATNESSFSSAFSFTTNADPVIAQFLPNLSDLNLFEGDLADLMPNPNAFQYNLATELFSDYSKKLRFLVLPEGQAMQYDGDGFPIFPDGTLMAKTFYYNNNELDLSQGRRIIETRILIRDNNTWNIGNYVWKEDQTDAVYDNQGYVVPISWVNEAGEDMFTEYQIPVQSDCLTCHSNSGNTTIIGPKLRSLNFEVDGINQLQKLIDHGYLTGAPSPSEITALPKWDDDSFTLEERARAYFDMQCAHCHIEGGMCELQTPLRLSYETPLNESFIEPFGSLILFRMQEYEPGFTMPLLGTSMVHAEGFELVQDYIESLD